MRPLLLSFVLLLSLLLLSRAAGSEAQSTSLVRPHRMTSALAWQPIQARFTLCARDARRQACTPISMTLRTQHPALRARDLHALVSTLRAQLPALLGQLKTQDDALTSVRLDQTTALVAPLYRLMDQLPRSLELRGRLEEHQWLALVQGPQKGGRLEPFHGSFHQGRFRFEDAALEGHVTMEAGKLVSGTTEWHHPFESALYDETGREEDGFSMTLTGRLSSASALSPLALR